MLESPVAEPVLLAELKDHLRLDDSVDDAALGALVSAARTMVEAHLGLALINRPIAVYLDAWPSAPTLADSPWWPGVREGAITEMGRAVHFVRLPVRPVQAVLSVHTLSADDVETVWGPEHYYLKPGNAPALYRKQGHAWPVPGRTADGIKITVTAGFGDSWNDVPAAIRQALLLLAAHLFTNRGDEPMNALAASGAAAFLAPYRDIRL